MRFELHWTNSSGPMCLANFFSIDERSLASSDELGQSILWCCARRWDEIYINLIGSEIKGRINTKNRIISQSSISSVVMGRLHRSMVSERFSSPPRVDSVQSIWLARHSATLTWHHEVAHRSHNAQRYVWQATSSPRHESRRESSAF